jgi:putative FmdB family regulatory protein
VPTYQYSCTECGHFFEQVQSFSDASLTECPACQGKLRKVFNAVGVVFKGSGFYRNDSRSENGSKTPATAGASKDGAKESGSAQDGGSSKDGAGKDSSSKDKAASTSTTSYSSSSSSSGGTSTSGSAA